MSYEFDLRIKAIFNKFEVQSYRECPTPFSDGTPWIEFELRPLSNDYDQPCAVSFKELEQLSKLLGTTKIETTGYDLQASSVCDACGQDVNDFTEPAAYIEARGVKFGKRKK